MDFAVPDVSSTLGQLRYRHLKLVCALNRTSNMHRAAEELAITQPAATKMLQDLETILGVQLFIRSARAILPTDIGKFVIGFAEQATHDLSRFEKSLTTLRQGGYGFLSIGAVMAIAPDILPAAIAELKKRRPLMTIELAAATSDRLLAMLETGDVDLVIGRLTERRQASLFDVEPLGIEELWAFCAKDHPLKSKKNVAITNLLEYPWVVQQSTSPMRQVIDQIIQEAGSAPLTNIVETTSIFATLHLVRRAQMIAVLPRSVVEPDIRAGRLYRIPLTIKNPLSKFGFIQRRGSTPSANVIEFTEILRDITRSAPGIEAVVERKRRRN